MGRAVCVFVLLVLCLPPSAAGQAEASRFQLGVQIPTAVSGEFDTADVGVGGRFAWHPIPALGAEAEIGFYPGDLPDRPAFSRRRVEGLFGVTAGPQLGRVRPFAKLRPGFVRFGEAPEPFACILIFPPPLPCRLAGGATVLALDLGGGLEIAAGRRTFLRADAGDRLVRYPGPVFDRGRNVREGAFFGHDFRIALGGGVRF